MRLEAQRCPEQAERLRSIADLLEQRPDDAALHFFRAMVLGRCGDPEATAAALERVHELGTGFLPIRSLGFDTVWDVPAVREIVQTMERELPKVGADAPVAFRLSDRRFVPEGIAHDPRGGRTFVGSVARGTIVVVHADGRHESFATAPKPYSSVLGLDVDPQRERLEAVVTNAILDSPQPRISAVLELDLKTGALQRTLTADDAGQLNDVAVGGDGTVYATDSRTGQVWRAGPEADALAPWPADVAFYGANGLVVTPDALYVAHASGIARIGRATGEVLPRVASDTQETLAAIDGLCLNDDILLGVQNVTNPGRVVAATLDATGTRVTEVRTLLSHHHPALAEPTTAAVAGDRLLVVANSFIERLQPDGTFRDPDNLRGPVVLALPLP